MKQSTLKSSFKISGKGLHTGLQINATFNPAPCGHGYKIKRVDLAEEVIIDALAENVIETQRGTVIAKGDVKVSTIEHALAALYAAGIDNCLIEVDAPELPILDGSAIHYVEKIEEVGIEEQAEEKDYYIVKQKIEVVDEKTGASLIKNGPCVQMGNSDTEKPRFVSMPKGMSLFTITLEQALSLFQNALPLTLGEHQGLAVVIGEGKYGPYIRYDGSFTSLPKNTDPYSVTLEQAIQLLEQKQQQEEPIHVFGDIQVLNGRYGAYIKTPQGNYKLPRGVEATTLTAEACQEIIAKSEPTSAAKRKFKSKK